MKGYFQHKDCNLRYGKDLVLAPGFYWKLFLQLKLIKLFLKYLYKKIVLDDTSIVVTVSRCDKLSRQFILTGIDGPDIERQLLEWGHHFFAGKGIEPSNII